MNKFLQQLKDRLETAETGATSTRRLVDGLKDRFCEEDLSKCFVQCIREVMQINVAKPKCKKTVGFFGYTIQPDDLECCYDGKHFLLECKVLRDTRQCDVRNAFSQLLEYLLFAEAEKGQFDGGCVVIFDERKKCSNIFEEPNKSFVNIYTHANNIFKKKPIEITAIRVFLQDQRIRVEIHEQQHVDCIARSLSCTDIITKQAEIELAGQAAAKSLPPLDVDK